MFRIGSIFVLPIIASVAMLVVSCKREERSFDVPPAAADLAQDVPHQDTIRPGPTTSQTATTTPPVNLNYVIHEPYANQYQNNAQAQSDGQRLYEQFNCVGCHAHGGGGMGPPLLDRKWIYGSDPKQVYITILEGRPNGMPSFRGRIPDYEIWELVAFVRSMSGYANTNAAAGREDHMRAQPPPNSMPPQTPEQTTEPATGPATRTLGP